MSGTFVSGNFTGEQLDELIKKLGGQSAVLKLLRGEVTVNLLPVQPSRSPQLVQQLTVTGGAGGSEHVLMSLDLSLLDERPSEH